MCDIVVPACAGEVRDSHPDFTRAGEPFHSAPVACIATRISKTVEWLRRGTAMPGEPR